LSQSKLVLHGHHQQLLCGAGTDSRTDMQHVFGLACSTYTRAVLLCMQKPLSRQVTFKTQVRGGKDAHQAYRQGSLVLNNSHCASF